MQHGSNLLFDLFIFFARTRRNSRVLAGPYILNWIQLTEINQSSLEMYSK